MNSSLNTEQKKAIKILMQGKNAFITGGAGTGKTFLLHAFLDKCPQKSVIVCAPTGIAAIQAGGVTMHRAFGIPVGCLNPTQNVGLVDKTDPLALADIIVIDEISMCRIDAFTFIARKIKLAEEVSHKHKQVIVVGDFYQLPPVVPSRKKGANYSDKEFICDHYGSDAAEGFAFLSPEWSQMHFETIELKKIVRQADKNFSEALNCIRKGNPQKIDWIKSHASTKKPSTAITLCSTKNDASKINKLKLSALSGVQKSYPTIYTGEELAPSEKPVPDTLILKQGCRVMLLTNDTSHISPFYSNGSFGKIVDLDDDLIEVKLDTGVNITLERYTWEITRYVVSKKKDGTKKVEQETIATITQFPVKLAYAITIHKAQGQTYDKVSVQPGRCFASGQLYVALSRVRSIDGLYIIGDLTFNQLLCSSTVQQFYNNHCVSVTTPPKDAVKPKPTKTQEKKTMPDKDAIESIYDSCSPSTQKAFLSIVGTASGKKVSVTNWLQIYLQLSPAMKKIASAALISMH